MRIHIHTNIDLFIYLSTHWGLLVLFENKTHGFIYKRGPSSWYHHNWKWVANLECWKSNCERWETGLFSHTCVKRAVSQVLNIRSLTFNFPNSQLIIEVPNCQQIYCGMQYLWIIFYDEKNSPQMRTVCPVRSVNSVLNVMMNLLAWWCGPQNK